MGLLTPLELSPGSVMYQLTDEPHLPVSDLGTTARSCRPPSASRNYFATPGHSQGSLFGNTVSPMVSGPMLRFAMDPTTGEFLFIRIPGYPRGVS